VGFWKHKQMTTPILIGVVIFVWTAAYFEPVKSGTIMSLHFFSCPSRPFR